MKRLYKVLPWFFVALFGSEIVAVMLPKKDGAYHWRDFGRLPVLLNGRVQPMDSVAHNALLQMRGTADVPLEVVPSWQFWHHPKKLKATEWLLEVATRPEVADTRPVFLISHSDLLGELKLQEKGIDKSGLRYYTFNELRSLLPEISTQSRKASETKGEEQTAFQKQVIKLANALTLYQRLKVTLEPEGADNFTKEVADFAKDIGPARAAAQAGEGGTNFNKAAIERMAQPIEDFELMSKYGYALIVPPLDPATAPGTWQNLGASLLDSGHGDEISLPASRYVAMATAYRQSKADDFNRALAEYKAWLQPRFPKEIQKGNAEFYFNDVKAFLHATIMYIFAFVLAGCSMLAFGLAPNLSESLRRSAFYLLILAWIVHTFGLVFRMALEGRPPVTNLYSSAIFIGWGAVVLGIILEWIYRVGIGTIVGSFAGFVTLLIAHNLALGGDTMEMLRAVLDTNFWLATHVVVITLGYASMFAAGLLAILYIVLGLFTPVLSRKIGQIGNREAAALVVGGAAVGGIVGAAAAGALAKGLAKRPNEFDVGQALTKMVYGIICFAMLFSFVGTVLGGIWADQSWGRFWGWDPKENGALLIVIWNAIVLHARWGGLCRERGLMNLAVFGNIMTSFSWFGVNMLGIGLHSYGFMDEAFKWLMIFMGSQLFIIALGLVPLRFWRSFRATDAGAATPAAIGGRTRTAETAAT